MRAIVNTAAGGPEVIEEQERPMPRPGTGEITVRVRASALNRADLLQRRGAYPAPPGAPADIPGLEYAGEVAALGDGVGLWAVGNRVMGITAGGSHAEYLTVHERTALRVPQNLGWEEAAAIPEVFLTAYDALFKRAELKRGERVLIHAVGSGVGTAALQLACAAGASVLGTSRTGEKLGRARELGLDLAIDTSTEDVAAAVRSVAGDDGVNVVIDLIGGETVEADLRVLAICGRIVVVGTMAGSKAELDLRLLLQKRARIIGTVLRSRPLEEKIALARSFSQDVLPMLSSGEVKPIIDRTYRFSEIADAHRYMESNESFGKIVLMW